MASGVISRPGKPKIEKVTVTIAANANSASLSAPAVAGYTFAFWLSCASSGWTGATYIYNPSGATTSVWVLSTSASARNVECYAVYV